MAESTQAIRSVIDLACGFVHDLDIESIKKWEDYRRIEAYLLAYVGYEAKNGSLNRDSIADRRNVREGLEISPKTVAASLDCRNTDLVCHSLAYQKGKELKCEVISVHLTTAFDDIKAIESAGNRKAPLVPLTCLEEKTKALEKVLSVLNGTLDAFF